MSKLEEIKKQIEKENKQKEAEMFSIFQKEYSWLLKNYQTEKFLKTRLNKLPGQDFKEKIFADFYIVLRQLYIATDKQKFINFLTFTKNSKLCSCIKKVIDENNGIIAGHSYIIVSNNQEILNNIATWILFELTDMNSNLMIRSNSFEYTELALGLERQQKQHFQNENEEIPLWEQMGGDMYYDIVKQNIGYVFPSESDEQKANAYINNRMLNLMNKSKDRGMIILTPKPIPFFSKRIQEGVKNLHILDLRNIATTSEEAVEME